MHTSLTAIRSAFDLDQSIRTKYKNNSGKRIKSKAVPIKEHVVMYLTKNAPLTAIHLEFI
jgi:hypothetical protein